METARKTLVIFQLNAPLAKSVFLAGSFNQWDCTSQPMTKDREGVWKTTLNLLPGNYEYLFVVDRKLCEDPSCNSHQFVVDGELCEDCKYYG